ncbi:hypothetical protein [Colwellia sp. MEBiC06753]
MHKKLYLVLLLGSLLAACGGNDTLQSCIGVEPAVKKGDSFFSDSVNHLPINTITQRPLAIACHNCYDYNQASVGASLSIIEQATFQGADMIELDIVLGREDSGVWVNHGTNGVFISLAELLSSNYLKQAPQMLFLELKGNHYTEEQLRQFLRLINSYRNENDTVIYANPKRTLVLRSFANFDDLSKLRNTLLESEFSEIKPHIRLSKLLEVSSLPTLYNKIEHAHQCGIHMVELSAELDTDVLVEASHYAKSFGLGLNVFTIYPWNYHFYLKKLSSYLDTLTVESFRVDPELIGDSNIYQDIKTLFEN